MIAGMRRLTDRLFGRGEAASTIPPFDGPLKPNQALETAPVLLTLDTAEDLATDGSHVYAAAGQSVLRLDHDQPTEIHRFGGMVTALCCLPGGSLAVAVDGREVRILGGTHDGKHWTSVANRPLNAVNALAPTADGRGLLLTDGSREHPCERWCHDLMSGGRSGRAAQLDLHADSAREIANGLKYAFGICPAGAAIWISESWAHRVITCGDGGPLLEYLPVYPSRITPAAEGGFWLTAFTARTQLVEFVLQETAYRRRMMREIEPRFWIAPKLSASETFLEPMQGAHIKTMGILKPWAPPRSYGLVIRLTTDGLAAYSLHSRADGTHHGVVAAVECNRHLYVLAKGCGKILCLPVAALEQEFMT
ncbi:SMP-30/gluconolactonase/LRE family protein [Acidibrevibacterium fodinaquatile]|uniref:hypothetical protein n=1 Tax=Acidibrevibacterium fodinaquatile TaxID=1969806 RepID=UPI000E0D9646|nr:hypothetical protein [Acidibrevibacterium fodinaquatile]